jgi:hypothetical protein
VERRARSWNRRRGGDFTELDLERWRLRGLGLLENDLAEQHPGRADVQSQRQQEAADDATRGTLMCGQALPHAFRVAICTTPSKA